MTFRLISMLISLALIASAALAEPLAKPSAKMKLTPLEHFELWSQRDLTTKERMNARRNLMNVRRSVGRDFATYPKQKVKVFYTENEVFREYTNTPVHVSGLFDGRIHLTSIEDGQSAKEFKSILWHEYTHALIRTLSKGYCPAWLNEGLSVYEEEKVHSKRRSGLRELLTQEGKLVVPIASLGETLGNFRNSTGHELAQAYNESYAIADYLMDRYSPAVIRSLLEDVAKTKDIEKTLRSKMNLSIEKLESRVVKHIQGL